MAGKQKRVAALRTATLFCFFNLTPQNEIMLSVNFFTIA
jgi:hypothetical protein